MISRVSLILVMVAVLFAGTAQPVSANMPAPDKQTAQFEIKFMEGMIDYQMMAVMMAEMCLRKVVHSELLTTCQNIITTQTQEIGDRDDSNLAAGLVWYHLSTKNDDGRNE